jgi:AraC-like DNA-binding protein
VSIVRDGTALALPSPFIMGLQNKPAYFSTSGRFEILGVRCFPWIVFDLLELSPSNDTVCVVQHPIAMLQPTLVSCIRDERIDDAINHIGDYCLRAQSRVGFDSILSKAGHALRRGNGSLLVREIAFEAHSTVRSLERKFKRSAGHSVKDVSALMRFEQARNRLWIDPRTSLARLAQDVGYADQAHLSRDFKRYSGVTPTVFARTAKTRQMNNGSDIVAFLQAEPGTTVI